ncbi:redoxin family protein [Fimbriimonas ginsengisoli]|uniref:Thiol-specific antioxidant family (AhpC/TSA) protein n=1 Tax=Fimbriimonas ginsengisoli Gsoil 348 TaxID=661478 RepID=A0A068NMR5_FIMGI|nr:redoxin family protein [Fimbriimonas ginsengisoli]AIE84682.1 Thiol-specific antioxidant family (AhpC/TSA) protein [Fimbriimonas ginsengisoli Gsoil 348]
MKSTSLFLVGLATIASVAAVRQNATTHIIAGEPTQSWSLTDSNGKKHSLSDYKGKFVVLEWTNKDCPFVRKHYESGNMQATQAKAKEMGAVWLTIISSAPGNQGYLSPSEANAYRSEMKVKSAATLFDTAGKVGRNYGAKTTPQIVVLDKAGNVVYNGAIDDRATPDPEDIKGAKNYALAALSEAMAGKKVTVATSRPYGCSVKY